MKLITMKSEERLELSSKKMDEYKRIDHGEAIGEIIFSNWPAIYKSKKTKTIFHELSKWING